VQMYSVSMPKRKEENRENTDDVTKLITKNVLDYYYDEDEDDEVNTPRLNNRAVGNKNKRDPSEVGKLDGNRSWTAYLSKINGELEGEHRYVYFMRDRSGGGIVREGKWRPSRE